MGRYSDEELDIILHEAMKCTDGPEDSLNEELKTRLAEKIEKSKKREVSLWWFPGLAGSILTLVTTGLFSFFMRDIRIFALLGGYSVVSIICIWSLTIIGIKKYGLIGEAVIK